jgi:divalent metal cation (Fe/Co/Zn/Cd) transporter
MNTDLRDLLVAIVLMMYGSSIVFVTITALVYRRECRPLDKPLSAAMVAIGLAGLIIYTVLRA